MCMNLFSLKLKRSLQQHRRIERFSDKYIFTYDKSQSIVILPSYYTQKKTGMMRFG